MTVNRCVSVLKSLKGRNGNQIKYSHMRTIEKVVEVAFVSLFIGAVTIVVVMACTGQVYASHTGLG